MSGTPITDAEYVTATENLWRTYDTINEGIRFADAKAGALLTINGVLISAALAALNGNLDFLASHPGILVMVIICGSCLIHSSCCCLLCIKPTLILNEDDEDLKKESTIYFGDIARRMGPGDFVTHVLNVRGEEDTFREIATQVYAVSVIADKKHRWIDKAVSGLALSCAFGIVVLIALALSLLLPLSSS